MSDRPRRALRSNFEPGSPREAVRRAQWKALGLSDADMLKPKIAVVNSSSELAICFSHLDGIAKVVKEAVREAGGLPFEIRTAAPSDFIISAGAQGGYMLASRDLVVNDMEIAVEGAQLDGMICLSSCDKTPPAHLMAAGRFNVPTILVVCGYQPTGHYNGQHVDIEEVFIGSVRAMFGKLSQETLAGMCDHAITGPGVCAGMGTANSMHIACEALGMTLPGAAPVLANSPAMFDVARRSARRIVEMVWDDLKPRDVMTPGAFRNAVAAVLAVSGSINCVKHLQATAVEAGLDLDVFGLFNEMGARVPVLTAVAPNGPHTIDAFEAAGGAHALLHELRPHLDLAATTVTGHRLADDLEGAAVRDTGVRSPRKARSRAPVCGPRASRHGSPGPRSSSTRCPTHWPPCSAASCARDRCSSCVGADRWADPAWPVRRRVSSSRSTPRGSRTTSRSSPTASSRVCATRG
jgi:dihydroxy-acid dehydratase